jgi:hypothetical protein
MVASILAPAWPAYLFAGDPLDVPVAAARSAAIRSRPACAPATISTCSA